MSYTSITIKPSPLAERLAQLKRKVNQMLGRHQFKFHPSTLDLLNKFRQGVGPVWGGRNTGKTTAILLYAHELMQKHDPDSVVVLTFDSMSVAHLADRWGKMFPNLRSPRFTSNPRDPRDLRGVRDLNLLIDESSLIPFKTYEEIRRYGIRPRAEVLG